MHGFRPFTTKKFIKFRQESFVRPTSSSFDSQSKLSFLAACRPQHLKVIEIPYISSSCFLPAGAIGIWHLPSKLYSDLLCINNHKYHKKIKNMKIENLSHFSMKMRLENLPDCYLRDLPF